jgi:hypothetical protein
MHKPSYHPIATMALALLLAITPLQVLAQSDVDRAFDMQSAPSRSRLTVDGEVKDAKSKAQSNVAARYTAKEQARAEEVSRLASNAKASESSGGSKYTCSVTCTGSWWASGSNVNVVVLGGSEEQAKELASQEANPYCRKQTNTSGTFKNTALSSGSAKCDKK